MVLYLKESSSQVEEDKGESYCHVASLEQGDRVQEHQVTRDYQQEQDTG